jgi:putative ABC transport system permease protein
MTALHQKLLRDLSRLRGQILAVALVVACGVATVVTTRTAYDSLRTSQDAYYADFRFGDVFAHAKRAPESLASRIASIPGVARVQTRVVFDVTLDVPGLDEPATGHLASIPDRGAPLVNALYLRQGRVPDPARRDEVVVSEAFARANGLRTGERIGAILGGRWQRLEIVGIALCPEFVYEIRESDLFPDNRRFGVLWMARDSMAPAFDMDGAFNDVSLSLSPGAVEADVIDRLDRLLERFGGLGAYGRRDQTSNRFVSDELEQNRVSGTLLPAILLGVAMFLLHVVLSRLVATQREQIGILKAFGYSNASVAVHYLEFALVSVLIGVVLGLAVGYWLGALVNRMYVQFYRFPFLHYEAGITVALLASGVSCVAAVLGALGAVRRAAWLPPAEAMRPEAPARFRAGTLERFGLRRLLTPGARMIARNVSRRPWRALLSVLGIALAVAMLMVGRFFVDSIRRIGDAHFHVAHREDATVVFDEALPAAALHDVAHLPGVVRTEGFRVVPARLRFEHRSRRTALVGLEPNAELRRIVGADLRAISAPPSGVLITKKLGDVLGVEAGDRVTVEVLEGSRPVRDVTVVGLVDELLGLAAYMDLDALHELMRESDTLSGASISVDSLAAPRLYSALKRTPAVAAMMNRRAGLASFETTLAQNLGIFTTLLAVFASILAFAMVYNVSRIALSERKRELASLRVLGFTRREVAFFLLGEQAILTLVAIPVGLLLGYQVCGLLTLAYQLESFRLPLVVTPQTRAFALGVVAVAAVVSSLLVRRTLDRIDLVAALKSRE